MFVLAVPSAPVGCCTESVLISTRVSTCSTLGAGGAESAPGAGEPAGGRGAVAQPAPDVRRRAGLPAQLRHPGRGQQHRGAPLRQRQVPLHHRLPRSVPASATYAPWRNKRNIRSRSVAAIGKYRDFRKWKLSLLSAPQIIGNLIG